MTLNFYETPVVHTPGEANSFRCSDLKFNRNLMKSLMNMNHLRHCRGTNLQFPAKLCVDIYNTGGSMFAHISIVLVARQTSFFSFFSHEPFDFSV